jgi:hypothetical protein
LAQINRPRSASTLPDLQLVCVIVRADASKRLVIRQQVLVLGSHNPNEAVCPFVEPVVLISCCQTSLPQFASGPARPNKWVIR